MASSEMRDIRSAGYALLRKLIWHGFAAGLNRCPFEAYRHPGTQSCIYRRKREENVGSVGGSGGAVCRILGAATAGREARAHCPRVSAGGIVWWLFLWNDGVVQLRACCAAEWIQRFARVECCQVDGVCIR